MIKEIYLKNWKSFEDGKLYIDPLTILIGTNASGKSNVLDALLFLQKISAGKQVNSAIKGDLESQGIRGGAEWAIRKGASEARVKVVIQSQSNVNAEYHYAIVIGLLEDNRIEIKSEALSLIKKRATTGKVYRTTKLFYTGKGALENPSITTYFHTKTKGRGRRIDLRRSHSILSQSQSLKLIKDISVGVNEVIEYLNKIFILDPIPSHMREYTPLSDELKSDAANIAGVLEALEYSQKSEVTAVLTNYLSELPENEIVNVWTEPIGKFQSDAMLYCSEVWNGDKFIVDTRGLSDGTLRFLGIMTALLTLKENSLLVIEEIDNGLHPSRANLLVKFLKTTGLQRNIDVICTTHNPAFLDALGNEMIVFISAVYRNKQTGASQIKLLEDIAQLPRLLAKGRIGKLTTEGLLETTLRK